MHMRRPARLMVFALVIFSFLIPPDLNAQQGNVWYFGRRAGLSFNSAPFTPLFDGQVNSLEGSSSICDENGDLLFYTDGETIVNRDHDPMLNGLGLKGHVSSFQSSVIVPQPGSKTIYYVFTTDALENDCIRGYNYSIVDMSLDGGKGDVTVKNMFLNGPSTERLTVVKGADFKSYWVITNEWSSSIFKVYKIDCSGLNTTPVVSNVGLPLNEAVYCNIGTLRVSPDGKKLIQTNAKGRGQAVPVNEYAQFFDFDNATGVITNPRTIPLVNDGYYFGAEFSPDSRFLYLVNTFSKSVHQFDVSSGNIATIIGSKQILAAPVGTIAGVSMGPDQKLYISTTSPYFHVINDPNNAGAACNLVLNQQYLGGRSSQLGVPNITSSFYANRAVDFQFQSTAGCNGVIQFTASVQIPGLTLNWDFGDGQTGSGMNPSHTYSNINTQYLVKLIGTDNTGCVYEAVSKKIIPAGGEINAAFGATIDCEALEVAFLDSTTYVSSNYQLIWDFGDGNTSNSSNPFHTYSQPGIYPVKLIVNGAGGCISDTITKSINLIKPLINAGPDIQVISSSPVQLKATGAVQYHWEPATFLDNPEIANPIMIPRDDITYIVYGTGPTGCVASDTIKVSVNKTMVIEVPSGFVPGTNRNNFLRPLLRLVDHINYFRVYNRWGQLMYETKEIGAGWDGTVNGVLQSAGAYTWMLEVQDINGKIVNKKGTTVLVR